MVKTVLIMDVGGTNTRARIIAVTADPSVNASPIADRHAEIGDIRTLSGFVRDLVAESGRQGWLEMAVLCCAGPVSGATVSMTNWPEPRELDLNHLIQAGLPPERTLLINDMEAACHGLMAHKSGYDRLDATLLYPVADMDTEVRQSDNAVLIIPGTGVGTAGLLAPYPENGQDRYLAVSCEVQHTPIPVLDAEQAHLLHALGEKLGKVRPSWEDFISAKGLENMHACIALNNNKTGTVLGAKEIAERAMQYSDADCTAALHMYYRCAGALAQVLALSFQPYGGIYLAGATTKKNIAFILQSRFLSALHDNTIRGEFLKRYPVYLVSGDLNLDGAAYMASQRLTGWRTR
ncbi:MAG: glucokinase [Gammaproteobacteria bacterium]